MVGWLLPRGPTKSQTQTSPPGAAARMLRTRSRTGIGQGAEACSQLDRLGCPAVRPDRGQHRTYRRSRQCGWLGHRGHLTDRPHSAWHIRTSLLLTDVDASTILDASTVVDVIRRSDGVQSPASAERRRHRRGRRASTPSCSAPSPPSVVPATPTSRRRPTAQAGPHRERRRPGPTGSPVPSTISASRSRRPTEVQAATARLAEPRSRTDGHRGVDDVLLRGPGQGLGGRPRRRPLGGLHRAGRRARRRHRRRPPTASPGAAARPPVPAVVRLSTSAPVTRPATGTSDAPLWRRLVAEFLGSALLAAVVIGSGIAAQQLSPGNRGLELLRERGGHGRRASTPLILMFGSGVRGPLQPGRLVRRRAVGAASWRRASGLPAGPGRWAASAGPSSPT